MTYQQFLDSLINGITMFYNGLVQISQNLLSNYIVITILGITLFVSLFYFFLNLILGLSFGKSRSKDLDNVRGDK